MTYFLEIILLLVLVPVGVFLLMRKKSPKDALQEAEKVLGSAITATAYCAEHGMSESALLAMIGRGEINAYESMGMLFVQNKEQGTEL